MDNLALTYSDFVNAHKMLIFSEKHPASRANCDYTKSVVMNRWPTIETLTVEQFSANLDI